MNVDAVVLAAGASTRMGRPKALLTLGTETFLERILRMLSAVPVRSVRVVLGSTAPEVHGARIVRNPTPGSAQLVSLQCALHDLPSDSDGLLVWPVDHPLVCETTIVRMLAAFETAHPAVVQPLCERPGHPVIFSARLYPELLAASPDAGARAVVRSHATERLLVPVDDPHIHTNIDRPETYEKLRPRDGTQH